jgi:subtilisin family serine protease
VSTGIIAAKKNGYGIEGITRGRNIKLMQLKVLGINYIEGEGQIVNVMEAIKYAEKMGASICNLSLGTYQDVPGLYEVIKNSKMLFITSAGNNSGILRINIDKKKQFPASYTLPNLITVSNLSFDGKLYPESNYGPACVDLAAPGTNILSTTIKGKYIYSTGTSFATPYVTGVAAVLYQYMENPSPTLVKKTICDSVTPLPSLNGLVRTGGMLNAHNAILLGI